MYDLLHDQPIRLSANPTEAVDGSTSDTSREEAEVQGLDRLSRDPMQFT
jgi:hypothetical protein